MPARCNMGQVAPTRSHTSTQAPFYPQKLCVAQIGRDDNAVGALFLPEALLLQRQQRRATRFGRDVSHSANTSGSLVSPGTGSAATAPAHRRRGTRHLLQAAGAQPGAAPAARSTRAVLRQAVHTLPRATRIPFRGSGDHRVRALPEVPDQIPIGGYSPHKGHLPFMFHTN